MVGRVVLRGERRGHALWSAAPGLVGKGRSSSPRTRRLLITLSMPGDGERRTARGGPDAPAGHPAAQLHRAAAHRRSLIERPCPQPGLRVQRHLHRPGGRRGSQRSRDLLPEALRDPPDVPRGSRRRPIAHRNGGDEAGARAEHRPQHRSPPLSSSHGARKSSYGRSRCD